MTGVFTRIRDRLTRNRARPDTPAPTTPAEPVVVVVVGQGSASGSAEPTVTVGTSTEVETPAAIEPPESSESTEVAVAEPAPVVGLPPVNPRVIVVTTPAADPPAEQDRPQTPAEVLQDRQYGVLDIVTYTLHTVMHSDAALRNLCKLVGVFVLVSGGAVVIAASLLYLILHTIDPGSAPPFHVLAGSVFGLGTVGTLGTLIGGIWMRIRRRGAAVTSAAEAGPQTPDAAPGSESGGPQP